MKIDEESEDEEERLEKIVKQKNNDLNHVVEAVGSNGSKKTIITTTYALLAKEWEDRCNNLVGEPFSQVPTARFY